MPPVMKRACDACIARKLRCDGGHPCSRCQRTPGHNCTFLKPAAKRGPKISAIRKSRGQSTKPAKLQRNKSHDRVPKAVLSQYIDVYALRLHSVWPVLDSMHLLSCLDGEDTNIEVYILALALSAATSTQLQLPVFGDDAEIDAAYLAAEIIRCRSTYDYRENPSYDTIVTSFFLHVYYATLLKSRSSMMFLQEAISFAKLLEIEYEERNDSRRDELQTLLTLLWVTERGYSFQCNYPILSCLGSFSPKPLSSSVTNPNERDLLLLADLFASFQIDPKKRIPLRDNNDSSRELYQLQARISRASENLLDTSSPRYVDFIVTKQWMRTILWQTSLSQGLLSFRSNIESMKYSYPSQIMRDLLQTLPEISKTTFVTGGQDQLLKLFETANNFADLILCFPTHPDSRLNGLCSPDLLFRLYEGMSPCLDGYQVYRNVICQKIEKIRMRTATLTADHVFSAPAEFMEVQAGEEVSQNWVGYSRDVGNEEY